MDGRYWEALPLEAWFLEVKEKMRSHDYIAPFGMYESLMGTHAEIIEGRKRNVVFIGRIDKRQGRGGSEPMILEERERE